MAGKKKTDKDISERGRSASPEKDPSSLTNNGDNFKTDEIVAGIFCSKRHTGQFNDRFETGELEFHQVFNTSPDKGLDGATPSSSSGTIDNWTSSVVHDLESHEFDTMDDIMEWPNDYDESKDRF